MNYAVTVVDDDELPCGLDWAYARTCDGVNLFIARSKSTFETGLGELLAAAWYASAVNGAGLPKPMLEAV